MFASSLDVKWSMLLLQLDRMDQYFIDPDDTRPPRLFLYLSHCECCSLCDAKYMFLLDVPRTMTN